jgi:ParE toxin of type II toxin-antitoxin system, parDE
MSRLRIRITRNFTGNLDAIERFLVDVDAAPAFAALLDDLFAEVLPALESFPDLGADFFLHRVGCRESQMRTAALQQRMGADASLRELIRGDYLLLYARRDQELFLLAIKHFRQLSYDLPEFWTE